MSSTRRTRVLRPVKAKTYTPAEQDLKLKSPLARYGWGRQCISMAFLRNILIVTASTLLLATAPPSYAQTAPESPESEAPPIPDIAPLPEAKEETPEAILPDIGESLTPEDLLDMIGKDDAKAASENPFDTPDYSALTEQAERTARLDALFIRLAEQEEAERANLIAEEIWAIWLESGSDSVNMLLRRGTAAEKRGADRLARRMYNHVTALSPDYVEGWSRSARLALEEEDLNRALTEVTKALLIEPRHFYALWTLGNILEQLGRNEQAYEAYKEANRLYPELKAVKDRVERLGGQVDGDVL